MKKIALLPLLLLLLPIVHGCVNAGRGTSDLVPTTTPTEVVADGTLLLTIPAGWAIVANPGSQTLAYKLNAEKQPIAKVMAADMNAGDMPAQSEIRGMTQAEKNGFTQKYSAEQERWSPPTAKTLSKDVTLKEINGLWAVVFHTTSKDWGSDPVRIVRADTRVGAKRYIIGVSYGEEVHGPEMAEEADSIIGSLRSRVSEK